MPVRTFAAPTVVRSLSSSASGTEAATARARSAGRGPFLRSRAAGTRRARPRRRTSWSGTSCRGCRVREGLKALFKPVHQRQIGDREDERHEIGLLEADAVLAGDRTADVRADLHDLGAGRHHARLFAGLARIVEDVRVEITVAGVKHVADAQPRSGDDLVHATEHVRKLRAWDHAVHHHIGWRHAAVCTEGGLASLPEKLPLGLAVRGAHLARARLAARLDDALGLHVHPDREAVELDQQRRVGVARITTVERVLDRLDGQVVDHLHRRRHEPARDDRRHRRRGLVDRVEHREHRLDGLRFLEDTDDDARGDPERALGADEDPGQVVAARLACLAAEPHDLAVRHDDLEPEDVIRGDAVLRGCAGRRSCWRCCRRSCTPAGSRDRARSSSRVVRPSTRGAG